MYDNLFHQTVFIKNDNILTFQDLEEFISDKCVFNLINDLLGSKHPGVKEEGKHNVGSVEEYLEVKNSIRFFLKWFSHNKDGNDHRYAAREGKR